jgi:putative FmdB family regulatory protein
MPNYDYACQTCGHRFEIFQSMNDAKLQDCPIEACPGPVKRLLGTGAGLIFKGSGFYQTDYRSNSYQEGAKKDGAAAKPAETGAPATPAAPAPATAPAAASAPAAPSKSDG